MLEFKHSAVDLPELDADDIALFLQASGSTGRPKAVVLTHLSILNATQCLSVDSDVFDSAEKVFG